MNLKNRTLSIFDILGPIMVGPSSNHTGGAVRIGNFARMILGEEPKEIKLSFYNSLAETYRGHMTDRAVVAGLLGIKLDDSKIKEALTLANNKKIDIQIYTQTMSNKNPNTIDITLKSASHSFKINSISIGGGEIIITDIDEFKVNFNGSQDMILLIIEENNSNIISQMQDILSEKITSIETIQGNSRYLICIYLDSPVDKSKFELIMNIKGINFIRPITSLYSYKLRNSVPLFTSIKEMLTIAKDYNECLPQVVIKYESQRSGLTEKEIKSMIKKIWHAMKEEIIQGLTMNNELVGGLMSGKDSKLVYEAVNKNKLLYGNAFSLAIARAIACGEVNASMGKIVAAPTAGAVGVIPAVILTTAEELQSKERDIVDALLVAAGIGVVIAYTLPLSGAMGGCQSEIGVASSMAAAAAVQMAGGGSEQIVNAMALALKNLSGLVCDTVAGPVEVPCIKRNVIGVVNAMAVTNMALVGIQSVIPPDEVISAMRNIQILMPMELKDTMLGGLGITETAIRLKRSGYKK